MSVSCFTLLCFMFVLLIQVIILFEFIMNTLVLRYILCGQMLGEPSTDDKRSKINEAEDKTTHPVHYDAKIRIYKIYAYISCGEKTYCLNFDHFELFDEILSLKMLMM